MTTKKLTRTKVITLEELANRVLALLQVHNAGLTRSELHKKLGGHVGSENLVKVLMGFLVDNKVIRGYRADEHGRETVLWKYGPAEAGQETPRESLTEHVEESFATLEWFEHKLRLVGTPQDPWIVGDDVAAACGYRDAEHALRMVPDSAKRTLLVGTIRGPRLMLVVNLQGLITMTLRSDSPRMADFRSWASTQIVAIMSGKPVQLPTGDAMPTANPGGVIPQSFNSVIIAQFAAFREEIVAWFTTTLQNAIASRMVSVESRLDALEARTAPHAPTPASARKPYTPPKVTSQPMLPFPEVEHTIHLGDEDVGIMRQALNAVIKKGAAEIVGERGKTENDWNEVYKNQVRRLWRSAYQSCGVHDPNKMTRSNILEALHYLQHYYALPCFRLEYERLASATR